MARDSDLILEVSMALAGRRYHDALALALSDHNGETWNITRRNMRLDGISLPRGFEVDRYLEYHRRSCMKDREGMLGVYSLSNEPTKKVIDKLFSRS